MKAKQQNNQAHRYFNYRQIKGCECFFFLPWLADSAVLLPKDWMFAPIVLPPSSLTENFGFVSPHFSAGFSFNLVYFWGRGTGRIRAVLVASPMGILSIRFSLLSSLFYLPVSFWEYVEAGAVWGQLRPADAATSPSTQKLGLVVQL